MDILILGAGALAREMFFHLSDFVRDENRELNVVFVDDEGLGCRDLMLSGKRHLVYVDWNIPKNFKFLVGVGSTSGKKAMVRRALHAGLEPSRTIIHPRALVQDAKIGVGGLIAPGSVVTTNVVIGDYVMVNLNCTIGHDSVLGDYATINPGVSVSGNVVLGEGVNLGTGTVVKEGVLLAADTTTGAQACIVRDEVDSGHILVGMPARRMIP